eukprot:TRINITY_DN1148_c2_g1_i1.p1 TRINITY_DN1148_c2_g1~~TRINITY_DN1148_c2_g1_i1.p1  ORF type:complete len:324 (-),score=97.14 TRINITY_DN1148_c2_g1_i1:264-1235(-)
MGNTNEVPARNSKGRTRSLSNPTITSNMNNNNNNNIKNKNKRKSQNNPNIRISTNGINMGSSSNSNKNSNKSNNNNNNRITLVKAHNQDSMLFNLPVQPKNSPRIVPINEETLQELQIKTNFQQVEVDQLYEVFSNVADSEGCVNKAQFQQALANLESFGLKSISDSPFCKRLFSMIDENKDSKVDFREFAIGLSFLCKGTAEEKLEASFRAYDLDGSGVISREELQVIFKSAWKAGFKTLCAPKIAAMKKKGASKKQLQLTIQEINEYSEEAAYQFTENVLQNYDIDRDGTLNFEEFKLFAQSDPKIYASLRDLKSVVRIIF